MQFHSFQIDGPSGRLQGDVRVPGAGADLPAVILLPDILVSRRHGFYPALAQAMAEGGRYVVTYDSAASGYIEGAQLDRTRAAGYTLSAELADLRCAVEALEAGDLPCTDLWDRSGLILVGHGKGAALALHFDRALRSDGLPEARAVILVAPPATLVREGWFDAGADQAGVLVPVDSPGPESAAELRLGAAFVEDARALAATSPLTELIATTSASVLIVAGEEDPAFPPREAEALRRAAGKPGDRLIVVEKTGHGVGLAALREAVEDFLRSCRC